MHKGFGTYGGLRRMDEREVFSPSHAEREIEYLKNPPSTMVWSPQNGINFRLVIPTTVYPPREDTDLLAKRIISLGPGRGRKFLEIGCGSGALSILAASMGWKVSCCDINPFAVIATNGNINENQLDAEVREGGVGPEEFPFKGIFDLIIWNLPYIPHSEISEVLGPMEEASLIDTDSLGLGDRMIRCIISNQLLAPKGRILTISRKESVKDTLQFAHRIWDEVKFEDGETLVLTCFWKPYEGAENLVVETTGSTNDDLLNKNGIGTHISSKLQTAGRGRRDRIWDSIEGSYAGSWIVAEGGDINPGHLQLSGALAVLNAINNENLRLKWPNDIMIGKRKLCGILAEGKSSKSGTKVILGVGLNLKKGEKDTNLDYSSLEEIADFTFDEIDSNLNKELSSLLEELPDIPPIRESEVRALIVENMRRYGTPVYNGQTFENFSLNERGELILGDHTIDDGEDIDWI
jgi:BirA family biotin operon repressor/biotin-[acetyl-CoA-carboxylase] ligase